MPKISKNAQEETKNSLEETSLTAVQGMIPYPVMVVGVNRKINTGNFENVDVYSGIAVPIMSLPSEGLDAFKEAAAAAAELGFSITSKETGDRYSLIKEMQAGGRK